SLTMIMLLSLFLVACSGKESGANDDDKVTLTFWNRFPEVENNIEDMINEFEEENPDIRIDMQYTPASTYSEQYKTAISNDELPDIYTTGGAPLEELVDLDKAHKLDEIITE